MNRYQRMIVTPLAAALVAAPLPLVAAKDETIHPGTGAEQIQRALPAAEQFAARVLEVQEDRLRIALPELKAERTLHIDPALIKALGNIADRSFTVMTAQRKLPSGIVAALVLKDKRGLYAVAESIRDRPFFGPEERGGVKVELLPKEGRTLVYDSECATVYNVSTAFTIGNERFVLQAHEAKDVRIDGVPFTLQLQASRWTVPKKCPSVFEGSQGQIDYALVRKSQ